MNKYNIWDVEADALVFEGFNAVSGADACKRLAQMRKLPTDCTVILAAVTISNQLAYIGFVR